VNTKTLFDRCCN